jgi:hypothetical protein
MVWRTIVGQRGCLSALRHVVAVFATVCSLLALGGQARAQGADAVPPQADPVEPGGALGAEVVPDPAPVPRHSLLTAIDVRPGATCLAADKLVRRVERWLNQTKVDARIRVLVRGDESDAYKVAFSIDRGDGQAPAVRRIDDAPADCEQLHSALALSIALAIDASILGGGELPDDDVLLEEPAQVAAEAPGYLRVALGVLGQLSTGLVTSDLAFGAAGRLELGFVPWLDLRVGVLFASAGGQRVEAIPGSYEASIVGGRADVCGAYEPVAVLRLLACGSVVVGQFGTAGHDYTETAQQDSLWMAAGGGLEAQALVLDQLALALTADLLIPFARRTIRVLDTAGMPLAERELTSVGVVIGVGAVFRVF